MSQGVRWSSGEAPTARLDKRRVLTLSAPPPTPTNTHTHGHGHGHGTHTHAHTYLPEACTLRPSLRAGRQYLAVFHGAGRVPCSCAVKSSSSSRPVTSAPMSETRPTKVRPEWRRAGFTSARRYTGWHGAASLRQLACYTMVRLIGLPGRIFGIASAPSLRTNAWTRWRVISPSCCAMTLARTFLPRSRT